MTLHGSTYFHNATIRILYPEDRLVSEDRVLSWARDAAIDNREPLPQTLDEAISMLEDLGLVTFARR